MSESVTGKRLTIHFDGDRCIHSRNCVLMAPTVFKANVVGAWIDPDAMDAEELIAVAKACPSGAIRYERLDGGAQEAPPLVNVVRVRENGPLAIYGELDINGSSEIRATLCRCGQSKNKPYCDGSHTAAGFTASGEAVAQDSAPLTTRNGLVSITLAKNGPLLVQGSLEVCTGTGHTITRTQKTALCRCGNSQNKPFCDGSHSRTGFVAE